MLNRLLAYIEVLLPLFRQLILLLIREKAAVIAYFDNCVFEVNSIRVILIAFIQVFIKQV